MVDVVFVAPFAMDATLRFVRAVADLEGVRTGLLTQAAPETLPGDLRARLAGIHRVADALDADQLTAGVRALAPALGGNVDRLLGILEPAQVPIAQVRERLGISGMDEATARNFREKARMKDVLREHGLPCAAHRLCATAAEVTAFARQTGFPLVVKPPAGAGAKQTFRVDDDEQLRSYLQSLPPSPAAPVLLEEFLAGREFSFDSVSLGGEHVFCSISDYTPTPLEVMREPWIQWTVMLPRVIDGPEYAAIREAGPRALACLGLQTGMTHLEWFRRDDGSVAISEVAARPPGAQFTSLISYAHDRDFYRGWAELMTFDRFVPPARSYAAGAAFLRGQGSGEVARVAGVDAVQREFGELIVEARLPEPGQPTSSSYEGEGYVIVRHPETDVVKTALQRIVSTLRVELR